MLLAVAFWSRVFERAPVSARRAELCGTMVSGCRGGVVYMLDFEGFRDTFFSFL